MMRRVTIDDADDLRKIAFCDPDWSRSQVEEVVGAPGGVAYFNGDEFIVGIEVDGELFGARWLVADHEQFWPDVKLLAKVIHLDERMDKEGQRRLCELVDAGFQAEGFSSMMTVRVFL